MTILQHRLMDESAEGGEGSAKPTETPEFQEALKAAVAREVDGLKRKNGDLIETQKRLKSQLDAYDGVDPEKIRALFAKFDEDEERDLLKDGRVDDVINRRTEKLRAELEATRKNAKTEAEKLQQSIRERDERLAHLQIDNAVMAAMTRSGANETAIEDAVLRARSVFAIGEDGKPIAHADGQLVTGPNGALTIEDWVEGMREKAPHWWPRATGTGAKGGGSGTTPGLKSWDGSADRSTKVDYIRQKLKR